MKKNILAIAIASAVAAPVAFADAPTVYGQFNLAIDQVSERGMEVVHRNSRLGVKGSEDLGNGLKAVYQMEATVAFNTLNADRNTFAGIAGGFGTVVMGRHDTPLRMIQPNDGFADSSVAGNNTSNFTGLDTSGEDRLSEVLAYISPDFNGISFAIAGATAQTGKDASLDNAMSYSVSYGSKSKGIYAAAASTTVANVGLTKSGRTNTRATVQFNEGGMLAYVMYNAVDANEDYAVTGTALATATAALATDNGDVVNGSTITIGGAYKMGAITPRAKIAMISYAKKDDNTDGLNGASMSMALGVDYALGKNTKVYAEYASLDKQNRKYNSVNVDAEIVDTTAISVGLFHKF